jgi:hypothetical protein
MILTGSVGIIMRRTRKIEAGEGATVPLPGRRAWPYPALVSFAVVAILGSISSLPIGATGSAPPPPPNQQLEAENMGQYVPGSSILITELVDSVMGVVWKLSQYSTTEQTCVQAVAESTAGDPLGDIGGCDPPTATIQGLRWVSGYVDSHGGPANITFGKLTGSLALQAVTVRALVSSTPNQTLVSSITDGVWAFLIGSEHEIRIEALNSSGQVLASDVIPIREHDASA